MLRALGLLFLCIASAAGFVLALLFGNPDPLQVGGLSFLVVVVVTVCSRSLLAVPASGVLAERGTGGKGVRAGAFADVPEDGWPMPRMTPAEAVAAAFSIPQEEPALHEEAEEEAYTRLLFAGQDEEGMRCRLVSLGSAEDIEIDSDSILVGSNRKADFVLTGPAVSRVHARIRRVGNGIFLTDLNSLNGTFVNGERLTPNREVSLASGDRVTFADVEYQLNISQRFAK